MPKRILSVSYDVSLLNSRQMLLQQQGYTVTSALGFTAALAACKSGAFDLFILGHSIPLRDKQELIRMFRANCPAPIVSLERVGEELPETDFHASPDNPAEFLKAVHRILGNIDVSNMPGAPGREPQDRPN